MKIIKEGTIPSTTKRFFCSYCGTVFECESNEYAIHFCQKEGDWAEAYCPICGERVTVDM